MEGLKLKSHVVVGVLCSLPRAVRTPMLDWRLAWWSWYLVGMLSEAQRARKQALGRAGRALLMTGGE